MVTCLCFLCILRTEYLVDPCLRIRCWFWLGDNAFFFFFGFDIVDADRVRFWYFTLAINMCKIKKNPEPSLEWFRVWFINSCGWRKPLIETLFGPHLVSGIDLRIRCFLKADSSPLHGINLSFLSFKGPLLPLLLGRLLGCSEVSVACPY